MRLPLASAEFVQHLECFIVMAYFCDLVGVGERGTADAERAHILLVLAYL